MTTLVSVVIPTFNRWSSLVVAVRSLQNQRLPSDIRLEIVVVDDASTEKEYNDGNSKLQERPWPVTRIRLGKGTKKLKGYPCAGYVRNCGLMICNGDYVGFLDDDDAYLPDKVAKQVNAMRNAGIYASWTDARAGVGPYKSEPDAKRWPAFNGEHVRTQVLERLGIDDYPDVWEPALLAKHNAIITSTFMAHRTLLRAAGAFLEDRPMGGGPEADGIYLDYEYWMRVAKESGKVLYIKEPLGYYDEGHATGQNY